MGPFASRLGQGALDRLDAALTAGDAWLAQRAYASNGSVRVGGPATAAQYKLGGDNFGYSLAATDVPPVLVSGRPTISMSESYSLAASLAGEYAVLGYGTDPAYTAAIAAGMGGLEGRLASPAAQATQRVLEVAAAMRNNPVRAAYGGLKGVVNFGPETVNLAINTAKLSLNGYSYLFGDAGASFRTTSAWNAPVWETHGDAELGGSVLGSLVGPWAYGRGAQFTGKLVESTASGVRTLAATLREAGLPDWNVRWNDAPLGSVYSNPLGVPVKLERVGNASTTRLAFEDALVLRGDASRAKIVQAIGDAAQPSVKALRALDPEAQVGFRGSLANGLKNEAKLGPNGERVAFDGFVSTKNGVPYSGPQGYDADFFVVSDKMAADWKTLGIKSFFRDAADLNASLGEVFANFGQSMNINPVLSGMKVETPTFRIFKSSEIQNKVNAGDAQIYFIPAQD